MPGYKLKDSDLNFFWYADDAILIAESKVDVQ